MLEQNPSVADSTGQKSLQKRVGKPYDNQLAKLNWLKAKYLE